MGDKVLGESESIRIAWCQYYTQIGESWSQVIQKLYESPSTSAQGYVFSQAPSPLQPQCLKFNLVAQAHDSASDLLHVTVIRCHIFRLHQGYGPYD